MNTELTLSAVQRQNILNNQYAVQEIEKATGISGIPFEGKTVVLKESVADFFGVTTRTIEGYLETHADELRGNGYEVVRGKRLKTLKNALVAQGGTEEFFGTLKTTSLLGIFDFRAFLNLGMLLTEGERARQLRSAILDIAIDTVNVRTGGGTKYINQRDEDFIRAAFSGETYRKQFTDALKDCVEGGNFKYATFTDKVYESIFLEKAREYRKILKLEKADKTRETFYAEVLDLIASYETGLADAIRTASERLGRPLTYHEADALFAEFGNAPMLRPLVEAARAKMASRDLAFRDALHASLEQYIVPVRPEDFERFIGDKSKDLAERLEDAKLVLKRLKERE